MPNYTHHQNPLNCHDSSSSRSTHSVSMKHTIRPTYLTWCGPPSRHVSAHTHCKKPRPIACVHAQVHTHAHQSHTQYTTHGPITRVQHEQAHTLPRGIRWLHRPYRVTAPSDFTATKPTHARITNVRAVDAIHTTRRHQYWSLAQSAHIHITSHTSCERTNVNNPPTYASTNYGTSASAAVNTSSSFVTTCRTCLCCDRILQSPNTHSTSTKIHRTEARTHSP